MKTIAAFLAQTRVLSVAALVIDALMMAAVGMLAMFVVLLASFQNVDALLFESGLRYDSRASLTHNTTEGLVIAVTAGTRVMSEERFDDPARWRGDFSDSVSPVVWTHTDATGTRLGDLLGSNIVSGEARESRVLLDEATAAALGVRTGDDVVLSTESAGECRLRLSGILRSFKEVGGPSTSGLLVVPSDACPELTTTWGENEASLLQFDAAAPSAGSQTWAERLFEVALAATDVKVSGLLPVILFVGLGLWTLMGWRTSRRVHEQMQPASDLLFDLGIRPARVRAGYVLVVGVLAVIAAVGAAWGAREALWHMAAFHIQTLHWVTVGVLFGATTILVALAVDRRIRRRRPRVTASTQGDS